MMPSVKWYDAMWHWVTACDSEWQHVTVIDTVRVIDTVTDATLVRRLTISTCLSSVITAVAIIISVVLILHCCGCQRRPNYRAGLCCLWHCTAVHIITVLVCSEPMLRCLIGFEVHSDSHCYCSLTVASIWWLLFLASVETDLVFHCKK